MAAPALLAEAKNALKCLPYCLPCLINYEDLSAKISNTLTLYVVARDDNGPGKKQSLTVHASHVRRGNETAIMTTSSPREFLTEGEYLSEFTFLQCVKKTCRDIQSSLIRNQVDDYVVNFLAMLRPEQLLISLFPVCEYEEMDNMAREAAQRIGDGGHATKQDAIKAALASEYCCSYRYHVYVQIGATSAIEQALRYLRDSQVEQFLDDRIMLPPDRHRMLICLQFVVLVLKRFNDNQVKKGCADTTFKYDPQSDFEAIVALLPRFYSAARM